MDEVLHYIGTHLAEELNVITTAPITFLALAALLAVGLYFGMRAYFAHRLSADEAMIGLLRERERLTSASSAPLATAVQPNAGANAGFPTRHQIIRICDEMARETKVVCRDLEIYLNDDVWETAIKTLPNIIARSRIRNVRDITKGRLKLVQRQAEALERVANQLANIP